MFRFFRDLPISRKLVLMALLTAAIALAISAVGYVFWSEQQFKAQIERTMGTLAAITADNCAAAVAMLEATGDMGDTAKTLKTLANKPSITWAAVYLKDGKLLASYTRSDVKKSAVPSAPPDQEFTADAYRAVRPIKSDKTVDGLLVIETDLSELNKARRTSLAFSFLLFGVTSLIAAVLAFRLQKLISGPIMGLAQTAREVTQRHNYALRAAKQGEDETGFLIDSFNSMLDQIEVANAELAIARDHALEASSAKSSFLANMSHEIRTPMNGIIGLTRLALQSELTPVQREYLEMVSRSADTLLQILNDILDFSKIEAGMLDFDPHPFSIRELVSTVAKLMAVRAHEKGLELVCEVDPKVRPSIVTDSTRLQQVLLNLTGNAVKFTEKGEVVIRVKLEEEANDEVKLTFSVTDTGVGIPKDKIASIFQAFSQADVSTTRKFGGTGLGLSISVKLVTMMGGKIWAESEPGKGSTFFFTLKAGISEDAPVAASSEPLRGLRLLVVDDNATNLRVMMDLLRGWEARPQAALGGPQALEAMREAVRQGEPFALVLLDMHMPDMDGFQLAHEIHNDETLSASVLMMLNSSNLKGDAERARSEGIVATMTKPVSENELLRSIATHLRGRTEKRTAATTQEHHPKLRMTSLRVMLAEDNKVNQTLAIITLEQMGHVVRLAENGRQAIELYGQENFDLILMDLQMPDMDGFQAVAAIRESELGSNRRVPIIALTAHALKGDRERCIASGMTGYVSKPLDPDLLAKEIALVTGAAMEEVAAPPAEAPVEEAPAPAAIEIDRVGFLKRCANNWPLAQTLIEQFRDTRAQMEDELQKAMDAGDAAAMGRAAHAIKGVVSVFGAETVVARARRVEELAKGGDLGEGQTLSRQLIVDCQQLVAVLEAIEPP